MHTVLVSVHNALLSLPLDSTPREYSCMRSFPLILTAFLLCWLVLAPAPASAQNLHCHPCWHPFGDVKVGTSTSFTVQVWNRGSRTITIASKTIQGNAFTIGTFTVPVSLQPGTSVNLPVNFQPTTVGNTTALITLNSNAHNSPLLVHVGGNGVSGNSGAQLAVTPTSLNFGSVTVGSSVSLQARLTASNAAVTISSDGSTSSEFAIVGLTLPVTIQSGQSLSVTIKFTPNASGGASGQAGFTSNAVNSPTVEQLTGTGVAKGSHSVSLTWNPGDHNAVGYNIYRGTAKAGPFSMINTALDSSTNYTDSTVVSGATYYYVTTEVNGQGQESGYSNEVQAVIPNP